MNPNYILNNLCELVPEKNIKFKGFNKDLFAISIRDDAGKEVGELIITQRSTILSYDDTFLKYRTYYPDVVAECINEVILKPASNKKFTCIGSRKDRGMVVYTLKGNGEQKELYGATVRCMMDKHRRCVNRYLDNIDNVYRVINGNVRYRG